MAPRLIAALAATVLPALAGPALACRDWMAAPGSLLEALEPLRRQVVQADDSPSHTQAAIERLQALRAAIRPGDAVSYMKAAYWAVALEAVGVSKESQGRQMILRAVEMAPRNAEFHFIAALAYFETDRTRYLEHWKKASALAEPGSPMAANLERFAAELARR